MFKTLPAAENTIYQQFARDNASAGGVTVFLYDDKSKIDNAYRVIVSGMGSTAKPIADVGDRASVAPLTLDIEAADLAFIRCNAVVHIRFSGTSSVDEIKSYAKRLDTRLKELVCR